MQKRRRTSRGVVLESPAITGDYEKQLPKSPSARNANLLVKMSERSTQRFGKSRSGGCSRTRKTRNSADHRQSSHHRRAELIGDRMNVADVKH